MFKSAINEHLYTEDETFITGLDTTLGGFSTPLRRLPNTSVNDARQTITQIQTHREPAAADIANSRTAKYRFFEELALVPLGPAALQLNEQHQRANQTPHKDLFESRNEKLPMSDEVLVMSLSSGGPLLLEDFIPPRIKQKNKNPIIVSTGYKGNQEAADDESVDAPSGEWTSPVISEALRRQVNKEQQFKALWANVVRLFAFRMTLLFGEYLYHLYKVAYHDENQMYRNTMWTRLYSLKQFQIAYSYALVGYAHIGDFQWILVALIAFNIVKLIRPQDQCKDLPLTNQQRELIGLQPLEQLTEDDGASSSLIVKQRLFRAKTSVPLMVPKYAQENELTGFMRASANDDKEVEIALKELLPAHKLRRS